MRGLNLILQKQKKYSFNEAMRAHKCGAIKCISGHFQCYQINSFFSVRLTSPELNFWYFMDNICIMNFNQKLCCPNLPKIFPAPIKYKRAIFSIKIAKYCHKNTVIFNFSIIFFSKYQKAMYFTTLSQRKYFLSYFEHSI